MITLRPGTYLAAISALALAIAADARADSKDLHMAADGAFLQYSPTYGAVPVAVDIENKGPNAKGVLHVSSEGFQMDYPIELPRGSKKRFFAYPQIGSAYGGLGTIDFSLDTDQGDAVYRMSTQQLGPPTANAVLLISDVTGDLAFFRQRETKPQPNGTRYREADVLNDAYVKPDRVPTRPVGYQGLLAIVLGTGAERLPDDAIKAIRTWTLTGGTLIFTGGAQTSILADPRWRNVLPIDGVTLTTVSSSNVLNRLGAAPTTGPMTLAIPKPLEGASLQRDGTTPIVVQRPYGLGRVAYIACNPFEAPLNRWPGRKRLFESLVKPGVANTMRAYLDQFQVDNTDPYSVSYYSRGSGYATYPGSEPDPFSTTLPPTSRVFTLMVAYFIVVVPINFIILRRLKKGEWAWVTSPLISVAFAGAFLSSAGDLYAAKLSRATRGMLFAREGDENGIFVGKTDLFFPQGGSFDLGIRNADSVGIAVSRNDYGAYDPNDRNMEDLHARDDGAVRVDQMSANNLTFRQISYREILPVPRWFSFKVKGTGRGSYIVEVANNSNRTISKASIVAAGQSMAIGDLLPGKSAHVEVRNRWGSGAEYDYNQYYYRYGNGMAMSTVTSQNGSVAIVGEVPDLPVGPQIGKNFPARSSIRLAFFAAQGIPRGAM